MEPGIDIWIARAEELWLQDLLAFAKKTYRLTFLPSHDHSHHLRVWNLSKRILREESASHDYLNQDLVEGVLISALFHDLGMAESTREDHGRLGRELCRSWFADRGGPLPAAWKGILPAIEKHDRKDAGVYSAARADAASTLLGILSVADDLEAMGVIGIYRYAEIYLHRGIPMEELGEAVLKNAERRFSHLKQQGLCPGLIEKHAPQYEALSRFYALYNQQLAEVERADKEREGHLGVINYIRSRSMKEKVRPESLGLLAEKEGASIELRDYFSQLAHEIQNARE